jgi:hypothetical protein
MQSLAIGRVPRISVNGEWRAVLSTSQAVIARPAQGLRPLKKVATKCNVATRHDVGQVKIAPGYDLNCLRRLGWQNVGSGQLSRIAWRAGP